LVLPFGLKEIDRHLPEGGLALDALHEVAGGSNGAINGAPAALFTAGIAARLHGQVLCAPEDLFARPSPTLRGNDLINELGKAERIRRSLALRVQYPPKADPVQRRLSFWFISTETVKSTVKVSCGTEASFYRKLGDTGRLTGAMNV
jgi:hypothetical protein